MIFDKTIIKMCSPAQLFLFLSVVLTLLSIYVKVSLGARLMHVVLVFCWTALLMLLCRRQQQFFAWLLLFPFIAVFGIVYYYRQIVLTHTFEEDDEDDEDDDNDGVEITIDGKVREGRRRRRGVFRRIRRGINKVGRAIRRAFPKPRMPRVPSWLKVRRSTDIDAEWRRGWREAGNGGTNPADDLEKLADQFRLPTPG